MLGGKGRGTRRDDGGGSAGAVRIYDYDAGLPAFLRSGRRVARQGCRNRSIRRCANSRSAPAKASAIGRKSAARLGPQRRARLDAGDDGYDPQSRSQRPNRREPRAAHRQRAIRLGRISPLHHDVLQRRAWNPSRTFSKSASTGRRSRSASRPTPKSTRRRGRRLVERFKAIVRERERTRFPQDVYEQLEGAIDAVFDSWNSKRAVDYRRFNKIPDDWGTAVNVMEMVFGNMGDDSGTGVAFTRNPNTGERALFGEYLTNAQGEDVVAGIRTPEKISDLAKHQPESLRTVSKRSRPGSNGTIATFKISSLPSSAVSCLCCRPAMRNAPRKRR